MASPGEEEGQGPVKAVGAVLGGRGPRRKYSPPKPPRQNTLPHPKVKGERFPTTKSMQIKASTELQLRAQRTQTAECTEGFLSGHAVLQMSELFKEQLEHAGAFLTNPHKTEI